MESRPFFRLLRAFVRSLRRPHHVSFAVALVILVLATAGIAGAENYKY
ncbi:MAG TPA: hypothetical protein VGB51_09290 [Actinomycetota bacterium]